MSASFLLFFFPNNCRNLYCGELLGRYFIPCVFVQECFVIIRLKIVTIENIGESKT